MEAIYHISFLK